MDLHCSMLVWVRSCFFSRNKSLRHASKEGTVLGSKMGLAAFKFRSQFHNKLIPFSSFMDKLNTTKTFGRQEAKVA